MSSFNQKMVDGYILNLADGYSFATAWFDVKNAFAFSISCTFSGGAPTGTVSLNCSNESDIASPMGYIQSVSPPSGGSLVYTSPADQPQSNGLDSVQITGMTQAITTTGTTTFNVPYPGFRWVQLQYVGSGDIGTTVIAWISVKW